MAKFAYAVKMTDSNYYTVYQDSLDYVATEIKQRLSRPNPLGAEGSKIRGSKVKLQWIAKCKVLRDGDHPKTSRPEELSVDEMDTFRGMLNA
jgi:hypothetical protein